MLELLEQQKKLTLNQWKIISAAIIGDMLDFFDFFLIGYVLAFIVGTWKLTFLESGTILLAAAAAKKREPRSPGHYRLIRQRSICRQPCPRRPISRGANCSNIRAAWRLCA
jgi:hypothetical protein